MIELAPYKQIYETLIPNYIIMKGKYGIKKNEAGDGGRMVWYNNKTI